MNLNNRPYERASIIWHQEKCARTFEEEIGVLFITGTIISTPAFFGAMRPVCSTWDYDIATDPIYVAEPGQADCWHVHIAAGDWRYGMRFLLENPLAFVQFERNNCLRIYETDKFVRRMA
jgi:hypothetical protein